MFKKKVTYILGTVIAITSVTVVLASGKDMNIDVSYGGINVTLDGKKLDLTNEAFIHNGVTYLPVRDVATATGKYVGWDSATKTVQLNSTKPKPVSNQAVKETNKNAIKEKVEDFSNVEKEYTLTAGNYIAGIDIPEGRFDVEFISGEGSISTPNYDNGISEQFDKESSNTSFKGAEITEGEILSIDSTLKVKLTFTDIKSTVRGRSHTESEKIILTGGNYIAGKDIPVGVYNIVALSGEGRISTTNDYGDGEVSEFFFGIEEYSEFPSSIEYNDKFSNALLSDGVSLKVSNELKIELIPQR